MKNSNHIIKRAIDLSILSLVMCIILFLYGGKFHFTYAQNDTIPPKAEWALNTKLGLIFPTLDYASDSRIIFHGYFGLFIYDIQQEKLINSIDLESLGCENLFTKDGDNIAVNQTGDMIKITPKNSDIIYYYNVNSGTIKKDDITKSNNNSPVFAAFNNFVNSRDIDNGMGALEKYKLSARSVPFTDNTSGALLMENNDLSGIYYLRGEKRYKIFTESTAPLPNLIKQSDSYYAAHKEKAQKSKDDFLNIYMEFLNDRDYAGICSLTGNADYDEKTQIKWNSEKANADTIFATCKELSSQDSQAIIEIYFVDEKTRGNAVNCTKKLKIVNEDNVWFADGMLY